jgi:hypothetical protein
MSEVRAKASGLSYSLIRLKLLETDRFRHKPVSGNTTRGLPNSNGASRPTMALGVTLNCSLISRNSGHEALPKKPKGFRISSVTVDNFNVFDHSGNAGVETFSLGARCRLWSYFDAGPLSRVAQRFDMGLSRFLTCTGSLPGQRVLDHSANAGWSTGGSWL